MAAAMPGGTAAFVERSPEHTPRLNVRDFGARGDGAADDTAAINAALRAARERDHGAVVYLPQGTYAVTELDNTDEVSRFDRSIRLVGEGRWITRIVPFEPGHVMMNMVGANGATLEDLHFDSAAHISQCAVYCSRSATSANANGNTYLRCWFTGGYSRAAAVQIGTESSHWIGCRFENDYGAGRNTGLWAAGGAGAVRRAEIQARFGGEPCDGPATDNHMFGCEFLGPRSGAILLNFAGMASYSFHGCTWIGGAADDLICVRYGGATDGRWDGPITFLGCHFEVFGDRNVVHYLDGGGEEIIWESISNYGGYYNLADGSHPPAAIIDYDRTRAGERPILGSSTWTTFTGSPNSQGTAAHLWGLFSTHFSMRPNNSDGVLVVTGLIQNSSLDVTELVAPETVIGCRQEAFGTGPPQSGAWSRGAVVHNIAPAPGRPVAWLCVQGGTAGELEEATVSARKGDRTVSLNGGGAKLSAGKRIRLGELPMAYTIQKVAGSNVWLSEPVIEDLSDAPVRYAKPTFVPAGTL